MLVFFSFFFPFWFSVFLLRIFVDGGVACAASVGVALLLFGWRVVQGVQQEEVMMVLLLSTTLLHPPQ